MVTILSFSARNGGNCGKIADYLKDFLPDSQVLSFAALKIQPCGDCNYECFQNREACPYFQDMECQLLETITKSAQAIFVVPNYCDYPNANFFVFNERSQCYFQGRPELLEQYLAVPKKFIVVSNTGKANSREAFTQHTDQEPQILFLSAKQYGKSSIQGDLLPSELVETALRAFLEYGTALETSLQE